MPATGPARRWRRRPPTATIAISPGVIPSDQLGTLTPAEYCQRPGSAAKPAMGGRSCPYPRQRAEMPCAEIPVGIPLVGLLEGDGPGDDIATTSLVNSNVGEDGAGACGEAYGDGKLPSPLQPTLQDLVLPIRSGG